MVNCNPVIVVTLLAVHVTSSLEYVDVKTTKGTVRGLRLTVNGTQVDQFAGIPYARPPVGRLRFARPVEPRAWSPEVLDTSNYEPVYCWDTMHNNTSEDCLYLSVWTPVRDTGSPPLPVFVLLFPGIFFSWLETMTTTMHLTLYFHGNRSDASGNLGEWDQAMVFKWVADNIRAFGGDPDQVTIGGISSGGSQTLLHSVSPVSRRYFHRAIFMSAPLPGIDKSSIIATSRQVAAMLNCTKADYTPCMRRKRPDLVLGVVSKMSPRQLGPFVGDDIFPRKIMPAVRQGRFRRDVPLLTGGHPLEYAPTFQPNCDVIFDYTEHSNYSVTRDSVTQCFTTILKSPAGLAADAVDHYLEGVDESDSKALRLVTARAVGHYLFTCPTYFVSSIVAKQNGSDVFSYLAPYGTRQTAFYCEDKLWPRPCHGDEWISMFGKGFREPGLFNDTDRTYSTELMLMWSSFAKTGQPAKQGSPYWPAYQDAPVAPIVPTNLGSGGRPIWPSYQVISPLDTTKTPVYKPYKDCDEFWSKYISIYDDDNIGSSR
ncbi:Acetylcholinesterase [Halotydeus destructor]|nr:Acetylcholinesterase [Halotydeus destructor]